MQAAPRERLGQLEPASFASSTMVATVKPRIRSRYQTVISTRTQTTLAAGGLAGSRWAGESTLSRHRMQTTPHSLVLGPSAHPDLTGVATAAHSTPSRPRAGITQTPRSDGRAAKRVVTKGHRYVVLCAGGSQGACMMSVYVAQPSARSSFESGCAPLSSVVETRERPGRLSLTG